MAVLPVNNCELQNYMITGHTIQKELSQAILYKSYLVICVILSISLNSHNEYIYAYCKYNFL